MLVRLTLSGILFCAGFGSALAAPPLPAGTVPVPSQNWVKDPAQATLTRAPNSLLINQKAQQVILNWQSFNIAGDSAVQFVQPGPSAAALNRIFDANPTVIQGRLSANGQIYLINTNGIVFDKGAQVNVHSLVASSLQLSDDLFLNGILSNSVTGAPSFVGNSGFIRIETGAQLQAASGGRILLFAPEVQNGGIIQTPDGQIMLAAGQKIYLAASTDPTLRGVLVEVDGGGTSTNLGTIVAERGNATLIGLAVNQSGRISASTSVTTLGSVNLLARDTTVVDPNSGLRTATRAGVVTLGENSSTVVIPDASTAAQTITDQQVFSPSRVQVMGSKIELQSGAEIRAQGANIVLNALANPSNPQLSAPGSPANGSRIYLAPGSVIDASGTQNVGVPMERNFAQVELRANELRDAALQKNAFLQGKTVSVDIRQGTPLADISGTVNQIGRTVAERTAVGGTIALRSEGDIVAREGAVLNVSGGSLNYQSGFGRTTKLRALSGKVVDIGTASPDQVYTSIVDTLSQNTFYPGYVDGKDAGSIDLVARQIALDATLLGSTSFSIYQRDAGHVPLGGRLVIGDASQLPQTAPDLRGPSTTLQTVRNPLPDDFTATSVLPDSAKRRLTLSTAELARGGFSRLEVYSDGDIRIAPGASVNLAAGGALSLYAQQIAIDADVSIPAGSVQIATRNVTGNLDSLSTSLTVASGVQISTRGSWVNDSPQAPLRLTPRLIDGGEVSLSSVTDLFLGTGSLIDVSGGAWLAPDRQLHPGAGGSIAIVSNTGVSFNQPHTGRLQLDGSLRGYAVADGGSLSITAGEVRIANTPAASTDALLLSPDFFRQGGFASYNVTGLDGVVVDGLVEPLMQNLVLNANYQFKPSGDSILPLSTVQVLRSDLRNPANLSLSASSQFFGSLSVARGSAIRTDPGGTIELSAGTQLTVDGELNAPGGKIALTMLGDPLSDEDLNIGFRPGQSIWLGSEARLYSRGATEIVLDGLLHRTGTVMRGGEIDIVANKGYIVAQPGSVVDVSAVSSTLDLPEPSGNRVVYAPREVSAGAGSIRLRAREGLLLDGQMVGAADRVPGSAGGDLTVVLDRQERATDRVASSYPRGEQQIRIASKGTSVPAGLRPGDPLDVANFNGKALVTAQSIAAGGFDSVTLKSRDQIAYSDVVSLSLRRSLTLDAPIIAGGPGAQLDLRAAYVAIGNTDPRYQTTRSSTAGTATLGAHADMIDVSGRVATRGIGSLQLDSTSDIRLRGVLGDNPNDTQLIGGLNASGAVTFSAGQTYPTTRSIFGITAASISFLGGGASEAPLSAGGQLTASAPTILVQGTLRAPLGSISLNASNDLTFESGSLVSTSAEGRLIPFGQTQNTAQWTYVLGDQVAVVTTPPQQTIVLNASNVRIEHGARMDLSGGGDLYAYEFFAGPGGSADVLNKPGVYAIVPTLGSAYAPRDWQYELGSAVKPGDGVYLSGIAGLPSGTYALLPAHYALLPGAFAIKVLKPASDMLPSQNARQLDGSSLVAGYHTVAGTSTRDSRWSTFLVTPGSVVRTQAEYADTFGSAFFGAAAQRASLAIPRLPSDAGRLAVSAAQTLDLGGDLNFATAGLGGQVDIAAQRIEVVSQRAAADGFVQIAADQLSNLGASSLLLGGLRDGSGTVHIGSVASAVQIKNDPNHPLTAGEILLAATDRIDIRADSALQATGQPIDLPRNFSFDGAGAMVRLSTAPQATIARGAFTRTAATPGTVSIERGATLVSTGSISIDATRDTLIDPSVGLEAPALSVASSKISFGAAPAGQAGLVFTDALLQQLHSTRELALHSYSSMDFYGDVDLGAGSTLAQLTLDTAALTGNGTVELRANAITLINSGSVAAAGGLTGGGTLSLTATEDRLTLGAGEKTISGFGRVMLSSAKEIIGQGTGSLTVQGDLTVSGPRVTGAAASNQLLSATGDVEITRSGAAPTAAPDGLGARLALSGSSIRNSGAIDLPAGQITLTASGSNGGDAIVLANGSSISAGGVAKPFFDSVAFVPAGGIAFTAASGNIRVEPGAVIDFSGASAGGDAGSLSVSAPRGAFTLLGTLNGNAQPGNAGGAFSLDVLSVDNFSAVNSALNRGGVTLQRHLRVRTGDVTIAASDSVRAQSFTLEVDQGRIDVAGTVDASATKNGRIELWSSSGVTLESTGNLIASSTGGAGGNITIGASQGRLDLQSGSRLDVSGTAGGGSVLLRAARELGDVGISAVQSTITGADSTVVEAVKVYNDVQSIGTTTAAGQLNINTVVADNDAFMANAAAIKQRLGKASDATFDVRPGVEVRSTGALALNSDWNLLNARSGGEPGTLTLRADGDLNLNRSLSDGFDSVLPSGLLQSGPSWSYRLVGGADLAASAPTAVATKPGGNVNLAPGQLVRTGTGDIRIAAAGNIRLQGADSVIYTAGAPNAPLAGFNAPAGATYSSGGGDVILTAGRDVLAVPSGQLITDWLYRQGRVNDNGSFDSSSDSQTSWWVSFKDFQQGVGALGGGNVHVTAGREIDSISVIVPTNARMPGTRPDPNNLVVAGGGDLEVRAAGDVRGGVFYVGRGQGTIRAGGSLSAPAAGGFAPILALNDGIYDVSANDALSIAAAFNPTIAPQGQGNILNVLDARSSHFFTYSPASRIGLTSLNGDITLGNDVLALRDATFGVVFSSVGVPEAAYAVYPGSLNALALQGSIGIQNTFSMYPSSRGDLQLRAAESINVGAAIYMSDADPAVLPQPSSPDPSYRRIEESLNTGAFTGIDVHKSDVLHTGDREPIRIYALAGDVSGPATLADFFGYFPKAAHIAAGRDLRDVSIFGQNVDASDVTWLQAGRDIVFSTPRNDFQQLLSNAARIEIGGPGQVELLAGRDIDLGSSIGVLTRGNIDNPALRLQGAGVIVAPGLGRDVNSAVRQPAYQQFIDAYIAGSNAAAASYREDLKAYLHGLQGADGFTDAEAVATLRALPPEQQLPFISGVLYNELRQAGRDATRLGSRYYDRGYAAITTLFPEHDYKGDLRMFLSQIKTEHGGDVDLLVPGGLVNEGLANTLSLHKQPTDLGIVTVQGGSVRAMVDGDFLVNQSRVFTLQGGDILIWSSNGNIDAGKGAKTTSYAPPPLFITNADGTIVTDLSGSAAGSGIGLLLTAPDIEPGSVDLFTPRGTVIASDAGIRSAGTITIGALFPPPPDNINADKGATGLLPSTPARPPLALAGLNNPALDAAQAVVERVKKIVQSAASPPSPRLSFISVEVIGSDQ